MNPFLEAVGAFAPLGPVAAAALEGIVRRVERPKGYALLTPGGVAGEVFWLERGLTRTFYYQDGRDVTDWLSVEGEFAGSMVSFLTGRRDRRDRRGDAGAERTVGAAGTGAGGAVRGASRGGAAGAATGKSRAGAGAAAVR